MFGGLFTMNAQCPRCGHAFMREPGFFQGAMYVSYGLGLLVFLALGFVANAALASAIGLVPALFVALVLYLPLVPLLYRYARVIWAHVNVVTMPRSERG
jgi:hypothetical protein